MSDSDILSSLFVLPFEEPFLVFFRVANGNVDVIELSKTKSIL